VAESLGLELTPTKVAASPRSAVDYFTLGDSNLWAATSVSHRIYAEFCPG
jgi:hypothetical protein